MVGWHHWLDGHEFKQALEVLGDGQGSLACCSPWGPKELDMTEWLNWGKKELLPRLRPGMQCKLLLIVPASHFALYPTCPVFIFFPCSAFRANSGVFWKLTMCPEALFSENSIELATQNCFLPLLFSFELSLSVLQVCLGSISTFVALWVCYLASFQFRVF